MSAIVGIYYLDGHSVKEKDLNRMVNILDHRGPDGVGIWNQGQIGLGHRMLWTTPESFKEKLPLMNRNGDLVITADARIDNRVELIATLELNDHFCEITDSQLILSAYEKWGEKCPEKLIGDFAFAIWDERKKILFCARDHFGVKPFYYYVSDRFFAFASEIKALLCLPEVPSQLNEVRVADYLASMFNDTAITFYQHISRLSPAYSITVSHKNAQLKSYWSLDPSRELRLSSDEEYADAFRELFTETVRSRLRSAFPVGSMLSGGLDSSSITCVGNKLLAQEDNKKLYTFSGVFNMITQCDERTFIHKVASKNSIVPHYVPGDVMGPLTDIDRVLWYLEEPLYSYHLFMRWRIYDTVKEQKVRTILDGFDGDTVVSSQGIGYMHELAKAKRWLHLIKTAKGIAKTHNDSPWDYILAYAKHYMINPVIKRTTVFTPIYRKLKASIKKSGEKDQLINNMLKWNHILSEEFMKRISLNDRYQAWQESEPSKARTERQEHYRAMTQGLNTYGLEVLDKTASAFSIETCFPFWDKRLVEFCLSIPPEQKFQSGYSRMVMRRAMTDILPVEIQWRRDKVDFTPNFINGFLKFERQRLDTVIMDHLEILKDYINIKNVQKAYNRFTCHKNQDRLQIGEDGRMIFKIAVLCIWLQNIHVTHCRYRSEPNRAK
jgi:asparagine synthase (glutamine-hydrolysing)